MLTGADQALLTYAQAAARLGHKAGFIARQVKLGHLRGLKFGHHTRRIEELELIRYIERARVPLPHVERRGGRRPPKAKPISPA